ncbi:MAG: hypothetical protein PHQ52_03695 [Candidatus Omnitrophica bacterium]|nr:hypothetical protein [Candidatus Omnitrophota bacterium]
MMKFLMVIIIIGILASLGIQQYESFLERSKKTNSFLLFSILRSITVITDLSIFILTFMIFQN